MLKVTIASPVLRELKGNSKASGKPYHLRIQTGYAHTMDREGVYAPFPEKFELMLDEGQTPYAPGEYTLHPSAVYVDRDGRLACSPRLTPASAKPAVSR